MDEEIYKYNTEFIWEKFNSSGIQYMLIGNLHDQCLRFKKQDNSILSFKFLNFGNKSVRDEKWFSLILWSHRKRISKR